MKRSLILLIGLAAATLFARLGVWQLQRLDERRDRNAVIAARGAAPAVDLLTLSRLDQFDTMRFRRARARGVFDFTRELVLTGRAYRGTPGVHLVTPLRLGDSLAVLVERGWVFSPDGRSLDDVAALREVDTTTVVGVLLLPSVLPEAPSGEASWPRYARSVDLPRLASAYPYTVLPLVLRRTATESALPDGMRQLTRPELRAGPHLSYAIQWFAFAVIALVGAALLFRRSGRPEEVRAPPVPR